MELILTKKTIPHGGCVEVDWGAEDPEISWVSLFYSPNDQEKKMGWSVGEELPHIFVEFLKACMSPGSHTYAFLSTPHELEYQRMIGDARKTHLPFVEGKDLVPGKRNLRNWGQKETARFIQVADVELEQAHYWFSNYAGWADIPYVFVVSRDPLPDWETRFMSLHDRTLRKSSLSQIEWHVMNHFEHGIEAIGLTTWTEQFESTSRHLANELKIILSIRENGKPF